MEVTRIISTIHFNSDAAMEPGDKPTDTQVAQTIKAWLAREKQVLAKLAAPGVVPVSEIAATDGLGMFDRMASGEIPSVPIGKTLGYTPVEWERGRMVFQGTPKQQHYNPIGTVHGGWSATLLDSAVACAVQTMLPKGMGYTTLEIKVNYVRGLTDKVGPVRAEGKVIHMSRQIATAEGKLFDAAGKVYSHATTTCLIFQLPS
jgi:uncharacterized protein (TIGR00369 family)